MGMIVCKVVLFADVGFEVVQLDVLFGTAQLPSTVSDSFEIVASIIEIRVVW